MRSDSFRDLVRSGLLTALLLPLLAAAQEGGPQPVAEAAAPPDIASPLTGMPIGRKNPDLQVETAEFLTPPGGNQPHAIRLRTEAMKAYFFPGVSVQPPWDGRFAIWSLRNLFTSPTKSQPASFWGYTDSAWDGNRWDYFHGECGNRVFVFIQGTGVQLFAQAAGKNQHAKGLLADYGLVDAERMPHALWELQFDGDKARLLFDGAPLRSPATDQAGWVVYTGDDASTRPGKPLAARHLWITLAGGVDVGQREMVIAPAGMPVPWGVKHLVWAVSALVGGIGLLLVLRNARRIWACGRQITLFQLGVASLVAIQLLNVALLIPLVCELFPRLGLHVAMPWFQSIGDRLDFPAFLVAAAAGFCLGIVSLVPAAGIRGRHWLATTCFWFNAAYELGAAVAIVCYFLNG